MSNQPDGDGYETARLAQRRAMRKRRRQSVARRADDVSAADVYRSPTQQVGDAAEAGARRLLEAAGLVLVAHNLSCKQGEIDLIMMDGGTLVFVEVRHRAASRFGGAAASVGIAKQRRIRLAAQFFLAYQWKGTLPACRFDVVAMDEQETTWIKDAFGTPAR